MCIGAAHAWGRTSCERCSKRAWAAGVCFECRCMQLSRVYAGILVYMALVDLIAVDFVETKRSLRSKFCGYIALFLGALALGILAIWA